MKLLSVAEKNKLVARLTEIRGRFAGAHVPEECLIDDHGWAKAAPKYREVARVLRALAARKPADTP